MGIPKKALTNSKLTYVEKIADSSHETWKVSFEEDGVIKKAFLKN